MARKLVAFMLTAYMFSVSAAAQTAYLDELGIRYYTPDGWQRVTEGNVFGNESLAADLGVSPDTLKAYLDTFGIVLCVLDPFMNVFTLKVIDPDTDRGASDIYSFTDADRQQFLAYVAGVYPEADVSWDTERTEYVKVARTTRVQDVYIYQQAYQTIMYGHIFSFEFDVYGNPPTAEQNASFRECVDALLFMGAQAVGKSDMDIRELTLPELPRPDGVAEQEHIRKDVPLEVDPLPSVIYGASLLVTGRTVPNGNLRYYINGVGIERFKADENGRFEVTIKRFSPGRNTLRIDAIHQGYGVVRAVIMLDQAETPAILLESEVTCSSESYTIQGLTLPDAAVKMSAGTSAVSIPVDSSGYFSTSVSLSKVRDYSFVFDVTSGDYKRNRLTAVIHREETPLERLEAFRAEAAEKNPHRMDVIGVMTDLIWLDGKCCIVFAAQSGERYLVSVADFLTLDRNMAGEMLMNLTGGTLIYRDEPYRTAELFMFIPD